MEIYHNPRCSTSRKTLAILEESGKDFTIRRYLEDSPSAEELQELVAKLEGGPRALIREKETIFKENYKGKELTDEEWIQAMVDHPRLIERPVVIAGDKAVIGRPPENVRELL